VTLYNSNERTLGIWAPYPLSSFFRSAGASSFSFDTRP